MANLQISVDEMKQRVALFRDLKPSSRPLVDAVLPQYHRDIYQVIGGGVIEDPAMKAPIPADGFHLSIVRCGAGKGTGLHNHKTVEVFMPLTGKWSVIWGDEGENELQIGQYDTISIPPGVLRGFRNDSDEEALLLALVGGQDPGRVAWVPTVLEAVKEKGFGLDEKGQIIELAAR
jgi:uncharacterized RmlC-like cupin family protein